MNYFKILAFTHKNLPLNLIGKLQLNETEQLDKLNQLKVQFSFKEILYLNTCNRVELFFVSELKQFNVSEIIYTLNNNLTKAEIKEIENACEIFKGNNAVTHTFKVAASLESLVVGEREIITQVRKAYEFCNFNGLTGDFIRLLIKKTIETAKQIYTQTNIAKNPVSIVSLAYRSLLQNGIKNNARLIFVGSGETNTLMATYLKKHSFENNVVFNRTLSNAAKLATKTGGKAYNLTELKNYKESFDVLIVCTASNTPVIDNEIYTSLLNTDTSKKTVIDLGVPANVDATVIKKNNINYIDINSLKLKAEQNLILRQNEIVKCDEIIQNKLEEFLLLYKERKIELAFGELPKQIKAIKELAFNEVFSKDINGLDNNSKDVLEKVVLYIEKKYNAVTFKTAKDLLLNKAENN
ncbi:MAG: glutamyl-tRNA reductase [Bacteroidetes bacterium]|nr:glutamyl-tRNA reductase [Bacteroidota bacterium]